ncbi:recombination protein NinG [uncultured Bacteroides sp.]|uniref:recombination protein NinG n=1 Tax=uncultured Bacteroides sp. TaxID=162156 RepID=UPI0025FFA9BF|nr:recombination protein NinG [uncultured Bacteroides sp.]
MPYYIKRTKAKKKDKPLPLFDKAGVTIKKKPDLKAKLDEVFSLYIRLRDSKIFGYRAFRCISCGKIKPFSEADCGHYFSRSHLSTRFDELNCWAECRDCNRINPDHLEGYQRNLIKKIGKERFELLEAKHNTCCKIDEDDYKKMIKRYTLLVNNLKNDVF